MPSTATQQPKSKIENGIPLPKYTKMPTRDDLIDDLRVMKPLQSRLIDLPFSEAEVNRVRTRIHAIQERHGLKHRRFAVNKDPISAKLAENDPTEVPKLRVWRVE